MRGARGPAGRRGGTLDGAGAPARGLRGNPELTCNGSNGRYINTLNQPTGNLPRPEAQRRYDLSAGGRRYEFPPDRGGYNPVLDPPFQCSPLPNFESSPPEWDLPSQRMNTARFNTQVKHVLLSMEESQYMTTAYNALPAPTRAPPLLGRRLGVRLKRRGAAGRTRRARRRC